MKKLIDYIRLSKFLYLLIILKRILFIVRKNLKHIRKSIEWLFASKEHTNFSLKLDYRNKKSMSLYLENNFNIDKLKIEKLIEFSEDLPISKKHFKSRKNSGFYDIDFDNKWDYRLVPFILFVEYNINYLFEFGHDHGRLPFLVSKYFEKNAMFQNYIGIDFNSRKGSLVEESINSENIKLINTTVEEYLTNYRFKQNLDNSIVVSSTHETNSEIFLFNYLEENNLIPKIIISDEVSLGSPYIKFIKEKKYKNDILIFNDKNNFLDPLYIGISYLP